MNSWAFQLDNYFVLHVGKGWDRRLVLVGFTSSPWGTRMERKGFSTRRHEKGICRSFWSIRWGSTLGWRDDANSSASLSHQSCDCLSSRGYTTEQNRFIQGENVIVESPMEPEYMPIQFYLRAMSPEHAFTVLMNNLSLSTSLYISPMLLHTHTNFPRYCLHRVMFVTANFHHCSLSKFRSKTHLCCSMSITTTLSLPCAKKFSDKGERTPMQILEVNWRDLPLCK